MHFTDPRTEPNGSPIVEMVYPVAVPDSYKTVCSAIFYALSRLNPLRKVEWQEVPSGTLYVTSTHHIFAQVFVLYATANVVDVRVHYIGVEKPYTLDDCDDLVQNDMFLKASMHFLDVIDEAVIGLLRVGLSADDLKPPPPPCTNMEAVFNWQRIYYPHMTDNELARRIGMEPQTVRNERSKHNFGKRMITDRVTLDELRRRFPLERLEKQPVHRGRGKRRTVPG